MAAAPVAAVEATLAKPAAAITVTFRQCGRNAPWGDSQIRYARPNGKHILDL